MSNTARYDLIVVGLGAMGSAVAYQARKRGLSVLGIDRYEPPHAFGSSHAETRISRLAVAEGPQYLPFVARSHQIWRELEDTTGEELLYTCGGLIVTEPSFSEGRWADFTTATADIAAAAGIAYERPDASAVRRSHPQLKLPDIARVGFEPSGAVVMSELAIAAQLRMARELGATIRTNEEVLGLEPTDSSVTVHTASGTAVGGNVVIAAGPWLGELAAPTLGDQVTVTRQVVFWFEADDLDAFSTDVMPFVIWVGRTEQDYFSLFPVPPRGSRAVKMLTEQFCDVTTADAVDRNVSDDEITRFYDEFVVPRVEGLTRNCIKAEACLYTSTIDDHFLIDTDPRSDRILAMSPCSGHGFKHSAALGEAVAELIATGSSSIDLTPFAQRYHLRGPG